MNYECKYRIGDEVVLDDDLSVHMKIIGVAFSSARGPEYRCSWMSSCDFKVEWIDEWRLKEVGTF